MKDLTEKQKKKLVGAPAHGIEQLLKEFNSEGALEKMKENNIDEEQFWELSQEDLKDLLDIQVYGRLQKLMKKVSLIKKEHLKNMEKEHPELKAKAKGNRGPVNELARRLKQAEEAARGGGCQREE